LKNCRKDVLFFKVFIIKIYLGEYKDSWIVANESLNNYNNYYLKVHTLFYTVYYKLWRLHETLTDTENIPIYEKTV